MPPAMRFDRRLVAGHQQQDARRQHLGLAQYRAPVLGGHQPAEQILPGIALALGQQLEEVLRELEHRLAPGGDDLLGEQEVRVEAPGQGVGPPLEPVLVLHGHAEQVADDPHGQRVGEGLEQVDLVLLQGVVEQLVDHLLGATAKRLDHLGGEGLGYQAAQPGVVGRVPEEERPHLQHGRGHRVVLGQRGPEALGHPLDGHVQAVRAGPTVAEDGQAVLGGGSPPRSPSRCGGSGHAPAGRRRAGRGRSTRRDRRGRRPGGRRTVPAQRDGWDRGGPGRSSRRSPSPSVPGRRPGATPGHRGRPRAGAWSRDVGEECRHRALSVAGILPTVGRFPAKGRPMAQPVLLITGTSSGIGLATAVAAAGAGYRTVATLRNPDRGGALRSAAVGGRGGTRHPDPRRDRRR